MNREKFKDFFRFKWEALHLRGYREDAGQAPLRETPAAAIAMRSGWRGSPLVDPMCGSVRF